MVSQGPCYRRLYTFHIKAYNCGMLKRKCKRKGCGKILWVYPSGIKRGQGKYCSLKCLHESNKKGKDIKCTYPPCKKIFHPRPNESKAGHSLYCSKECGIKDRKRKKTIFCLNCGDSLYPRIDRVEKGLGKFCSKTCFFEYRRDHGKRIWRVCLNPKCRKKFFIYPSDLLLNVKRGLFCSYACRGAYQTGKRNPAWLGGKSFEPYTPAFTNAIRNLIRARDNYTCQLCRTKRVKRAFSVHHIDYDKKNSSPTNLITLCLKCHIRTNVNRKYWAKYLKKKIKAIYQRAVRR